MKDNEAKIIDMLGSGAITAEQAKVLLDEIREDDQAALRQEMLDERDRFGRRHQHHVVPPVIPPQRPDDRNTFERIIGAIAGGRTNQVSGILPSDLGENDLSMSRVDVKGSGDYSFRANRVRMSDLSSVHLTRSHLLDNELGSSSLHDVKLTDSTLSQSIFHSSSLHDVVLEGAMVSKLGLRASRLHDAKIVNSTIDTLGISASSLKNFTLSEESTMHGSRFDASQISNFTAKRTHLQDVEIDVAKVSNLVLTGSTLRMSMVRGYKWSDVKLINTVFEDVLFGSGEHTKTSKFHDVTFENCNLTRAIFADTTFTEVTVRNVTLTGIKVMGVTLRDAVIDGNEAFLAAVGLSSEGLVVR